MKDVYIGVPVRLGKGGVEEILELELTDEEYAALKASADDVREGIEGLRKIGLL